MRRSALAMVAWLGAASALAFVGCGDNDPTHPDTGGLAGEAVGGAASGGAQARGGSGRGGGENGGSDGARGANGGESSGGGGGTILTGGTGTTTGGRGGDNGGTGAEGGSEGPGGGGVGGSDPPLPPICERIVVVQRQLHADHVALAMDGAVSRDCRLSWFSNLYFPRELSVYLNEVSRLTMVLWGCVDEAPAGFKLAFGTVALSAEEVDALISRYLTGMRIEIALSDAEVRALRSELERLAEPRIDPNLHGFTHSTCPDDGTGGEGGAAGAGP